MLDALRKCQLCLSGSFEYLRLSEPSSGNGSGPPAVFPGDTPCTQGSNLAISVSLPESQRLGRNLSNGPALAPHAVLQLWKESHVCVSFPTTAPGWSSPASPDSI